ncbi:unnamed protein product [Bursaphelenchus xylophilus]|uniref:ATP-dependent RNA helicase n=1 Tax=Bursaphelenchus xylophilus TaxID=6326 RepID=A0A1I7SRM9_BURXY|nr:unnamed protein product [Bursaphelenchus xylophilus]CAG9102103.1 unnamed protein product [Bursaphelenchus xylophilus]
MAAFEELGMLPELASAVEEMDWTLPTDIQSEGIPAILGGGDVLMAAETGSGKTGAFCLPILQVVWESMRDSQRGRKRKINEQAPWKMNIFDRDANTGIDNSGLTVKSTHPKLWNGTRCTTGVTGKGKYYFEAKIETDGLVRVGLSTLNANLNLGTDDQGYGFGGTGKKSHAGNFEDYGESFTLGDVIGCFIDLDFGQISFSKNGQMFDLAFKIAKSALNSVFYPTVVLKNAAVKMNFGEAGFKFPPPEPFTAISAAPEECQIPSKFNGTSGGDGQKRSPNAPMCVIVEPTKELAQQTYDELEKFKKFLDAPKIRNVLIVGGAPIVAQKRQVEEGVDIICCTLGRLKDLVHQDVICLNFVRFFVIDEADSLVSQGDASRTIRELKEKMPVFSTDGSRLQMIVCSATLHNADVKRLADQHMHFPQWVDLKGQDSVPDTVHQVVCMVDPVEDKSWIRLKFKPDFGIQTDGIHSKSEVHPGSNTPETLSEGAKVLKFVYLLKAIEEHKMQKCIVFCRTKLDCDHCEQFLNIHGHSAVCMHSDRDAAERTANLEKFRSGKVNFLVCTDVAARGLDVKGVPFVINVTLPPSEEISNYVHRIGRVGRADRMGLAISLVSTVPEKVWYHQCKSKGARCENTKLVKNGGCAKWYDEKGYLNEIETHLGITIDQVDSDFVVPLNEYDGKVVYGDRRQLNKGLVHSHAVEMARTVKELAELERTVQLNFLNMRFVKSK